MVHKLHRRLPAPVLKKNNRPIAILAEVETDFCSDPFFRPVDHLPEHAFAGFKLENLHVETAVAEAKLQLAADLAFAARGSGPPDRLAPNRRQAVDHIIYPC